MSDITIGNLVVTLSAGVARLQQDMAQATGVVKSATNEMQKFAEDTKKALELIGIGISVYEIVDKFKTVTEGLEKLLERRRQWVLRIGATEDEALGLGGALNRPSENQGLDLVVQDAPGALSGAREAGRHLGQDHHSGIRAHCTKHDIQQSIDWPEVAATLVISGHVGSDIDNIATGEIGGIRRKGQPLRVPCNEFIELGLGNRQIMPT